MTATLPLIKPRRLEPGQTIGLVAPASPINEDVDIEAGIETVESLGFKVKPGAHLYRRHGYLAGTDAERASDLNAMFADPDVDGIFCICGGYGSSRLLPALDYDCIRANPKALVGYSDITSLLNAIYTRTGLVTFHGPMPLQSYTPYTCDEWKKVLVDGASNVPLGAPPPFTVEPGRVERTNRITRWGSGKVQGKLLGGCLSLFSHLCGTPYLPDCSGAIVFLEDVGEATYRLDGMLTQLWLAGVFDRAVAVVFGKFTDCGATASGPWQFTQEEVFNDLITRTGKPGLRGLMIGHVTDKTTLPLGCQAEVDLDAGTLYLLEAGVV